MSEFLIAEMAPLMFGMLVLFLLSGFPVAFSLAANGLFFGFLGIELGLLQPALLQALPNRLFGIMGNDTLLAIPFFTLMGLILERSGMAEDLLDTIGQLFGSLRGGVAYAVILVGALLAATTGVVAASVISMGLISLPVMLRYGYDKRIATGTIAASATLAQIVPPSLVLIVMADQLGRSVGDMYKAALYPSALLILLYLSYVFIVSLLKPNALPALPPDARNLREPDGSSGAPSLLVLLAITVASYFCVAALYGEANETPVLAGTVATAVALGVAIVNRVFKIGLLSRMAEKVVFVMIPPLALIFLVLGTILLGIATPTEGGGMGAVGALVLAALNRRLNLSLLKQALDSTTRLSAFVMFILIGSSVFSLVFRAVNGDLWVEHLMSALPGGNTGFLIAVNLLFFSLGCFLDFFEIAFILVPLIGPVAETLDINLVWLGVLLSVNLQTSFMTPPFGFSLFYLRSVTPKEVKTSDIYVGMIPFILIQAIVVSAIIIFPELIDTGETVDMNEKLELHIDTPGFSNGGSYGYGGGAPDLNFSTPSDSPPAEGAPEESSGELQLNFSTDGEQQ